MSLGPLMIDLAGTELSAEDREVLRHELIGGVILFSRNFTDPAQLRELVAAIHALRSPPLLTAVDQEGGRVQRFRNGFTALPAARSLGRRWDIDPREALELARSAGWLMASELRAVGVDFSFAPCVDLDYGVSEAIGDRALHADAEAVGALAAAFMVGMREAGMHAVAKHFPGHGAVAADTHVSQAVDRRSFEDLEADLQPYRLLIDNQLAAVLAAHVVYPRVDDQPAGFSRRWIDGVLRQRLQFHGCVFTDDLGMAAAARAGTILQRVERALAAGCDMALICNDREAVHAVLDASGNLSTEPASRARVVRMRARPGAPVDLAANPQWREAVARIRELGEAPAFSLQGNA
ncbi:MAG: beta-N-acetylhexosaminidase [Steroidobacteraceae bacterium]